MPSHEPRSHGEGSRRRSRSRSPHRHRHDRDAKRRRSRSPRPSIHRHDVKDAPKPLPYQREHLRKDDLRRYEALFAAYLDIQKRLILRDLPPDEAKGRFKSFLGKWNRGELPEGWYDPDQQVKIEKRYAEEREKEKEEKRVRRREQDGGEAAQRGDGREKDVQRGSRSIGEGKPDDREDEDDEDDDFGPAPPSSSRAFGAAVPGFDDLRHRRELAEEDREARLADARHERKQDRKQQREHLDELAPRAEPGTRERQLEKKREAAASNRAFADAKGGGDGIADVPEADLLGGDDSFKARVQAAQRVKNERGIRREEVLRARAAEREERLAGHRQKEEQTMDMLRQLAKQRYG